MGVRKITEELDFLQKKLSAVKEIYKLYPDTVIKSPPRFGDDDLYISHIINKDVDTIRFYMDKSWLNAYTSKRVGCIEISSTPEKFALLVYFPGDMFRSLIVQNYHDSMKNQNIPESLIRQCDLKVISFIKERGINLATTNLKEMNPDTTIGKLLTLL